MDTSVETYLCKHYVTYKNTDFETKKKLFNRINIIKMMFDNKINLDKINPSESVVFRESIIKHILSEKNLKGKVIYKHFNTTEMEIIEAIFKYIPIVKNILKINMQTC